MTSPPTILIYVQHLLGIGHLKRAAAIARELSKKGARVVVASGGMPEPRVSLGGAELVQLPPAVSADATFSAIHDAHGRPIDDAWKAARRDHLLDLFERTKPDALLIEMYPFGRRQFRFELIPLLERARAAVKPPVIAGSVRDILIDKKKPERTRESADMVRRFFDLVLVHGDPKLIEFGATFPLADAIADRLRYTGYVGEISAMAAPSHRREQGEVLVSAGGGAVGMPLLTAAIAAKPLSALKARPWRVIAGNNLPESDFVALRESAKADSGITLERFRTDFTALMQACHVSVSQGGYNTVMELIATRTPAVIVPFAEGQESEQGLRARLLERQGVLRVVAPEALTPGALAQAIDAAAAKGPSPIAVDLDGAATSAKTILDAVKERAAR